MNFNVIAVKKGILHKFDFAMKKISITKDYDVSVGNYVLIHFLDHWKLFGKHYFSCENQTHLNEIKSKLLNNGFKVDWVEFNKAMEWVNDH